MRRLGNYSSMIARTDEISCRAAIQAMDTWVASSNRPYATPTKPKPVLPWFAPPAPRSWPIKPHLAVIGGGLAGAAVAQVMAQSGWQITVIDRHAEPAQEASGNLAGLVHPLITADWNLRSQFYYQGLQATWRWVAPWLAKHEVIGDFNGLEQRFSSVAEGQNWQKQISHLGLPKAWVSLQTKDSSPSALIYRQAGWLSPPSLIKRALMHPNIRWLGHCDVEDLLWQESTANWMIKGADLSVDAVVLANGALSKLNQAWQLPIRPLKGQVSYMDEQVSAYPYHRAIAHQGYSTPAVNGVWVTGATFEAPDVSSDSSLSAHQKNVDKLARVLPDWRAPMVDAWQARVGFRPTTADHLPIIGAIPERYWLEQAYLSQAHNKALFQYPKQRYYTGLWVTQGHGARGLMSVWWAAELIRDQLLGSNSETAYTPLHAAVHPGRFQLRPWRKGKG